jgi:DNA-binding transcriptional LysR family regulator
MLTVPNFERLKIFHLVYLNKSIQKAADVLNVTRSAVSQSLKALEGELGTGLFIRDSKKFQATPQAEELFRTIDPFISELHATLQNLESGKRVPRGHLRIGAPLDFGSSHLTQIIGRFREKHPSVTFELCLAIPVKQLEMLARGELEMAFIDNGDLLADRFPVTIQTVMREEFVLAASEKVYQQWNLKSGLETVLSEVPIVDYVPHAPVMRMWLKNQLGKKSPDLKVVYSAESVQAVLHAISSHIGIGVVPRRLLVGEFSHLKLIGKADRKSFINEIMLARQQGRKPSAKESEFIRFYKEQSQS